MLTAALITLARDVLSGIVLATVIAGFAFLFGYVIIHYKERP